MSVDLEIMKSNRQKLVNEIYYLKNQLVDLELYDTEFEKSLNRMNFLYREIQIYDIMINDIEGA